MKRLALFSSLAICHSKEMMEGNVRIRENSKKVISSNILVDLCYRYFGIIIISSHTKFLSYGQFNVALHIHTVKIRKKFPSKKHQNDMYIFLIMQLSRKIWCEYD
jgi:hypothetical protein